MAPVTERRSPGGICAIGSSSWSSRVSSARINAPVDPDEELAAITFMAGTHPETPALLFSNLVGNRTDARILSNMLGASKERYALAVGLDPDASTSDLIMRRRAI
mgnify:CR=1 FL=1